ncbi:hypothetical protein Acr_00g0089350 [Actinidia rufa]|uniref:Retrovirus-related Pol polyprotein from transposon TNT 1-94-like beta-barrel domain-containing protein n=1 Tax=Actinidia rufa TaxID=165716 RepID=A0A7J0DWX9_9ERIC|nr:hypothetical protein Acr_00g0089350 [Actinidia rufa]
MTDDDESDVLLTVLKDGKSDWVLNLGRAYHLCRNREVFSTYAACEGRIWMANNTASRVVGRGSIQFRMVDGRFVTLTKGELLSDVGLVVLARRMDKGSNRCTEARRETTGVLGGSIMVPRGSGVVQERREMLWDMYRSLLCAQGKRDRATTTRKVTYFAVHPCGGLQGTLVRRSYGEAGSEDVKKDNLKTSEYPLESTTSFPWSIKGRVEYFDFLRTLCCGLRESAVR